MKLIKLLALFHDDNFLKGKLQSIFGQETGLLQRKADSYRRAVGEFARTYGDKGDVIVARAPARINLMGVHVDHRGGYVNYIPLSQEIVMVVRKRDDDLVNLHNVEGDKYPARSFHIGRELPAEKRGDWLRYIEGVKIAKGDWSNYIRAGVLSLQNHFPEIRLSGMDLMVNGDIRPSSGLSSSSALVVASAISLLEINGLEMDRKKLVDLCAGGEWYVGTRGGAGDHSAMLFGKRGSITHVRFFPLEVTDFVPFPEDYKIVMCNCLKEANKSASAKDAFNQRIAAYEIGLMLVKKNYPSFAARLFHLRDVNEANLKVDAAFIYEIMKSLPAMVSRESCLADLPDNRDVLERIFRTHEEPAEGYNVRGVCLFGLAECKRGEISADLLKKGDIEAFGKLMYVSHDGDRVFRFDEDGSRKEWNNPVNPEYLDGLISKLRSGKSAGTHDVSLQMQPGAYRCSCEELDELVDISKRVEGVAGASLTGAGLGGCVLVLVRADCAEKLIGIVDEKFYRPRQLPCAAEVCIPAEGAGILDWSEGVAEK